jgi:hypothetical protein
MNPGSNAVHHPVGVMPGRSVRWRVRAVSARGHRVDG